MDLITLAAIIILGASLIFSLLLFRGAMLLLSEQETKMGVIMANYKSDLEITLLHIHSLDEFMKNATEGMKPSEHPVNSPYA